MNELSAALPIALPGALGMLGLILFSGFFSSSETALFYLPESEVRRFRNGTLRERLIARLLADPDRLLTAILFYNLVINLLYFALSVVVAQKLAREGFETAGLIFGLASLLTIILFGEVLPKSVAVIFPRGFSKLVVGPLAVTVRGLERILPFFRRLANGLRRTFFHRLAPEPVLSADDLERALQAMPPSEEVIERERAILERLITMSDMLVEELMRPRDDLEFHSPPVMVRDLSPTVLNFGYVLIWDDDEQAVQGVFPFDELSHLSETPLETRMQPVTTVPWCATAATTLQQMRDRFAKVACVVDEYGDLIGVVSGDDLFETLLTRGTSRAERVLNRKPILRIGNADFHAEGLCTVRSFCEAARIPYDPEPDDPLTIAGLLQEELDRFPELGDEIVWRGWRFRVIDLDDKSERRTLRVYGSPLDRAGWLVDNPPPTESSGSGRTKRTGSIRQSEPKADRFPTDAEGTE